MADKTINELTALTSAASADEFGLWDSDASATKKITLENLEGSLNDGNGVGAEDSPTFASLTSGNITLGDSDWVGIGASAERIVFDATNGDVSIMGADVGIGTTTPNYKLVVSGDLDVTSGVIRRSGSVIVKSSGSETMIGPGGSGDITFHNSATMTSGDEVARIDSSGIVDWAEQSAGQAYLSADQGIPSTGWTKIEFDSTHFDRQSEWDVTTNYRWTATRAGIYLVVLTVYTEGATVGDNVTLSIYINGTEERTLTGTPAEEVNQKRQVTAIFNLSANDYLEGYLYTDNDSVNFGGGANARQTAMAVTKLA